MIFLLKNDPLAPFPAVKFAEQEPNGLLAVGGDLSPERLVNAYRHGVFPWYSDNEPILWWSPDPRTVLYPERVKISRSLGKTLRKEKFQVTLDTAFSEVIHACAEPRPKSPGTWLMPEMKAAYAELHEQEVAHSVEVWQEKQLVGGLYGVAIGGVFFGESMFSRVSDSSKVAFVFLCRHLHRWGYRLIDCQVYTEHLASLGAEEIPRSVFCQSLDAWCNLATDPDSWKNTQSTHE
ncbi:MAG: leucyl/phenylalanyl-tRNA--protein transferase [gamma proteobacterium endosymbiont of Lamellibrachia anaximandri]|nr:leucyl/phenylalanyl-tRNA--protein transferase [gamma proteobacterium endosymbiont of Lamellibrachia anaximandri]